MNTPTPEAKTVFLPPPTLLSRSKESNDSSRAASSGAPEELAACDKDEQRDWADAIKSGQNWERAHVEIREKYHSRFLDIVKRHNEAPVYRVQFPAPFAGQ